MHFTAGHRMFCLLQPVWMVTTARTVSTTVVRAVMTCVTKSPGDVPVVWDGDHLFVKVILRL